jgi:hypothetical protein
MSIKVEDGLRASSPLVKRSAERVKRAGDVEHGALWAGAVAELAVTARPGLKIVNDAFRAKGLVRWNGRRRENVA